MVEARRVPSRAGVMVVAINASFQQVRNRGCLVDDGRPEELREWPKRLFYPVCAILIGSPGSEFRSELASAGRTYWRATPVMRYADASCRFHHYTIRRSGVMGL